MKTWVADLARDAFFATRSLRRNARFTAFVLLTLALGIGSSAAMFSIVDTLLLRGPEHVRDQARVKRIVQTTAQPGATPSRFGTFAYVAYDALRTGTSVFAATAAYSTLPEGVLYGRGADAQRISRGTATPSFFDLLGAQPFAGRFFGPNEGDPASPTFVAVLGHGFARRAFGQSDAALGAQVYLDGRPFIVIGIAPQRFTGPDREPVDVWIPESAAAHSANWTQTWNQKWLSIVARLKPGVSDVQAGAEATRLLSNAYASTHRGTSFSQLGTSLSAKPLQSLRNGEELPEARLSRWLLGVSLIVLLIACAGTANFALVRAIGRRRELAVRQTLGAGQPRLTRLLVVEAMMLALASALGGFVLAIVIRQATRSILLPNVEWGPVADVRFIGAAILAACTAAALIGFVSARHASGANLVDALKAGVREGGGPTGRTRAVLTAFQAAFAVVLLVGAGLFAKSLRQASSVELGLEPDRVLTFSAQRSDLWSIADTVMRRRERERRASVDSLMVERALALRDVESASLTVGLPFGGSVQVAVRIPGLDSLPRLPGGGPYVHAVTSGYFATVGTKILRGRAFTRADRAGSTPVVIVNQTMADKLWPGRNAIGECVIVEPSTYCAEIVGIAANVHRSRLREDEAFMFYVPFGQGVGIAGTQLLVRPRSAPHATMAAMRGIISELDPTITFVRARTLQQNLDPQLRPWKVGATMLSLMGLMSLVVAAAGLYSVVSYQVTQRTQEIGIRVALGAGTGHVLRLVLYSGLRTAAIGTVAGVALAAIASRFIEPLLFSTSPTDPAVFVSVPLLIMFVAALASALPALRAGRVSPLQAMKLE